MGGTSAVPGRGRKPKPQEIKRNTGNPGKRELNNNAPNFSDVCNVDVPTYLEDMTHAAMMWRSVIPELLQNKVLKITDMHNVEMFCIAYHNLRSAQKEVASMGITIITDQGSIVKNPALTAVNEASKQMASFGAMLGLDPSSRGRLMGGPPEKKKNQFAEVLNM